METFPLIPFAEEYLELVISTIGTEIEHRYNIPGWARGSRTLRDSILFALEKEALNRGETVATLVQAIVDGAECQFMNGVDERIRRIIYSVMYEMMLA